MILYDHTRELLQQFVGLLSSQFVDVLWERSRRINTFPSRDWIRSNYRMVTRELSSNITRVSSWFVVEYDMLRIFLRGLDKAITDKSRRQTLKELLIRRRETVIYFVA